MRTYIVVRPGGTRTVQADRHTYEPSGHVAFWASRRGDSADRLVLAVDDAIEIEEHADA